MPAMEDEEEVESKNGSITTTAPPSHVTLRTVDLGGQREYLATHPLFCTSRSVYTLCVPLDECVKTPAATMVQRLREYMSMVAVRAPDAPVVVVFTKADKVPGVTAGDGLPTTVASWVEDVTTRLSSEFPQVSHSSDSGSGSDDSSRMALVVSSKDGWEARQAAACGAWANVALTSPGAGDKLPRSYGAMRDALRVAGEAWKDASRDDSTRAATTLGAGEHKGVEGDSAVASPDHAVSSPSVFGGSSDRPCAPLFMRWGVGVPVVTVAAVRKMAVEHCGLSPDADIHQPLTLLHHMGAVVYGGAICTPFGSDDGNTGGDDSTVRDSHVELSQLVILDPQWLADMLSRVVTQYATRLDDHGRPTPRGRVSLHDVALAWHGYPDGLRGSFLEVLFALEIAFPGVAEDGSGCADFITVPALLPSTPEGADEEVAAMLTRRAHREKQVRGLQQDAIRACV